MGISGLVGCLLCLDEGVGVCVVEGIDHRQSPIAMIHHGKCSVCPCNCPATGYAHILRNRSGTGIGDQTSQSSVQEDLDGIGDDLFGLGRLEPSLFGLSATGLGNLGPCCGEADRRQTTAKD
ncbi:hypothetical protein B0T19DRAFT_58656 [Cercophora scortea]|uniref:Uncharacterized protein n=1 Tax=Cercophora scortea TaxID=314031 RepID=A0AAE0J4Z8_9PEZI|nr:hypothetical protein B0T19DRAFT_58656 [Cercophora scortea]